MYLWRSFCVKPSADRVLCVCVRMCLSVCSCVKEWVNELKHFVNTHYFESTFMICNNKKKKVLWKNTNPLSGLTLLTCDSLFRLAGMYFLPSSECASSCWCIAAGRQSPCYCVSQGRNQSICLQEMHVPLLFPFSGGMFVSPPLLTIRSHKQSARTKVSKLDQPQEIGLKS